MKVLMRFIGKLFDIVEYPNMWMVVASATVMAEVNFWQDILLKN